MTVHSRSQRVREIIMGGEDGRNQFGATVLATGRADAFALPTTHCDTTPSAPSVTPTPPPPPNHNHTLALGRSHNAALSQTQQAVGLDVDAPPAKRRKLAGRETHSQTTLDHHFHPTTAHTIPPPTKVTVAEPHGQLLETLNGVTTALDLNEDDLLKPTPSTDLPVPRRISRSTASTKSTPPPVNAPQRKSEEKRTLRSHDDGPRLKSELATYFPNYEDIIFDAPQEEELLTADTNLYIVDEAIMNSPTKASSPEKTSKTPNRRRTSVNGSAPPLTPQRNPSNSLNGSPVLNLDIVSKNLPDNPIDPLSDEHFLKAHKRAERREKQLRNIERERAMHEKVQLDRLLDGLQGHDWLKVLGITGITDGEAKKFEPKRDYFISEVQALVDKFKQWKEQEKKQRLEKEAALAKEAESDASPEGSVEPPSSDLNASAARQLQQETFSTIKLAASKPAGKARERAVTATGNAAASASTPSSSRLMLPPPSPELPITSFYAKRHLRDAALNKARHGSRNVTAFGQPLPEMPEREFVLPADYVTADALKANARERRRRKRESVANAAAPK